MRSAARAVRAALAAAGLAAALTACGAAPGDGAVTAAGAAPSATATPTPADTASGSALTADDEALDPFAAPLPLGDSTAAPTEFTIDDQFPGVAIHLVTGGGIRPWDVELRVARDQMVGPWWDRMPGGAWQISVPQDAPPLRPGSTLTLPYAAERLDGFPEQDLRIFAFDSHTRTWLPAADDQTVDVASHTVTAPVDHLPVVCAVLSVRPGG
jgi:hypothetical protein